MDKTPNTAAGATVPEIRSKRVNRSKVPARTHRSRAATNADWWPKQLNLKILHQHSPVRSDGEGVQLRKEFKSLDLDAVTRTCMP